MATSTASGTFGAAAENAAARLRDGQSAVQEGMAEALRAGNETVKDARDAASDLDRAARGFIRERPYTALAIAGAVGFLYAVARGR